MNWRESGQADLLKRLTAIHRSFSSKPLYTTLGAFSPCSDTMLSGENPFVAVFNSSQLNSLKLGSGFFSPFSTKHRNLKRKRHYFPTNPPKKRSRFKYNHENKLTQIRRFKNRWLEVRMPPAERKL